MTNSSSLILENSLQVYFFDSLMEANKKSMHPLPNEIIYYASLVMEHLSTSNRYFEIVDGKVREKILGIRLLEVGHLPKEKQKGAMKDIAETALLLCGYFADSLNKKIIDVKYYNEVGILAYRRLNSFIPKAYDTPNFFQKMSKNFHQVTNLISLISANEVHDHNSFFLITPAKKAI